MIACLLQINREIAHDLHSVYIYYMQFMCLIWKGYKMFNLKNKIIIRIYQHYYAIWGIQWYSTPQDTISGWTEHWRWSIEIDPAHLHV